MSRTPDQLMLSMSTAEMRREYSRMRQAANKRIARFERAGLKNAAAYREHSGGFETLSEVGANPVDIAFALSELEMFMENRKASVSGYRESLRETLEALQGDDPSESGYDFLNMGNIAEYIDFQEELRRQNLDRAYGSAGANELFEAITKKKIDPREVYKDFAFWLENRERLEKLPDTAPKRGKPANYYRKMLRG